MIRKRTFAHVLGVEDAGERPLVVMAFRSQGEELEALRNTRSTVPGHDSRRQAE